MAERQATHWRPAAGEGATLVGLIVVGLALFAFPLVLLFKTGLTAGGAVSLGPLAEALQSRSVWRALVNSLDSSLFSAMAATVLGCMLALVVGLTDVRGKGPLIFLILLPMMIPPHVTAIAWIQALGPASPVLGLFGLQPDLGSDHPLYSRGGVILVLTLQHAPLVFLIMRAAIRSLPREMSDAARIAGAGPAMLLRRILLPLLAPALIAGFALAFVSALGNFGIPALLGIPARYTTLPVLIWRRLASFGPDVLGDVAVLAAIVACVAIVAVTLQFAVTRRARTALIGLPQQPLHLQLGRWRPAVEAMLWAVVAATLFLPVLSLTATALVRTYGLPLGPDTATLENFAEVLLRQSVTIRAFVNSTLTAGAAALVLAGMGILLSYYLGAGVTRRRRLAAGSVATLADIAYAVPGLVLSIAFILAFIRPLPLIGVSLYGSLGIIFLAYLCAFFAIALKPIGAAYAQLDPSLDDAARVSGARFGRRMGRVFAPLVGPAAASGAILVFLTAYNEVTVSTLLWSSGSETIGTTIFNYEDGGYTTLAASMATVTVVVTVGLMFGLDRLGRVLPAGVVPWRG